MRKTLSNYVCIILGWVLVLFGVVGMILPILPTTPFLIAALALFARSSPRFHHMLLSNNHFGPVLKQWEDEKTVSPQIKRKASTLIIVTFSISIAITHNRMELQLGLITIGVVLLFFIWQLKEVAREPEHSDSGKK